jgi:hypothetical protein
MPVEQKSSNNDKNQHHWPLKRTAIRVSESEASFIHVGIVQMVQFYMMMKTTVAIITIIATAAPIPSTPMAAIKGNGCKRNK